VEFQLAAGRAILHVIGQPNAPATRIENRIGEPAANPYLYIASQIHAGLDGIKRQLKPPLATQSPYHSDARLPENLEHAVNALAADGALHGAYGAEFANYFMHIKRAEIARHRAAVDPVEWERRGYFGGI
jgi:glutamine synthetase